MMLLTSQKKIDIRKDPPYDQSQRKAIRIGESLSNSSIQHVSPVVNTNSMQKSKKYSDPEAKNSIDVDTITDEKYLELAKDPEKNKEELQRMVDEAAENYLNEMLLPNDDDEKGFKYHRGKAPTKTFKRYAVFNVKKDGFHAAYAGNKTSTPVGVWLDAQNLKSYVSDITQFDDGTFASYFLGDTGAPVTSKFSSEKISEYGIPKSSKLLLERGGKHSSNVPNFSQMNLKQDENGNKVNSSKDGALPHNKLIFEIEYGIDDSGNLTEYVKSNGRMSKSKNQGLANIKPNQYYDFKTNPNAVGNWGIGGTFKIIRLVPHDEIVQKTIDYKRNAIDEATRLYENGSISKSDMLTRVKNANSITVQKWVNGYHPEDFNLSVESVDRMYKSGTKSKLIDPVTYDDNGNIIPLSQRFNDKKDDTRYSIDVDDTEATPEEK